MKYYESFIENGHLYIIMELVDGVSLLDQLNSLAEKNKRMEEEVSSTPEPARYVVLLIP